MKRLSGLPLLLLFLSSLSTRAQDPDIDRLLRKLPPPEKLVQRRLAPSLAENDPAARDPMVQELDQAMRAGRKDRGLALARKISARYPKSVFGHFVHGVAALTNQQYGESAAAFRRSAEIAPSFGQAQIGLGVAEAARQHYGPALTALKKATAIDPKSAPSWIIQSEVYERMGRKQESLRAARQGTALAPTAGVAWAQLARAESALGHRSEALSAAGKAMRFSPTSQVAAMTAPAGSLSMARPTEGVRILRRATKLQPNNSLIKKQLQAFLFFEAQAKRTLRELRRQTAARPKSAAAWQQLGVAYEKLEQHKEARAAFATARRLQNGAAAQKSNSPRGRPANSTRP
ncbi:MAG: hypothetical protein ACR2F0_09470 [Chthoniobacterales bacterium]